MHKQLTSRYHLKFPRSLLHPRIGWRISETLRVFRVKSCRIEWRKRPPISQSLHEIRVADKPLPVRNSVHEARLKWLPNIFVIKLSAGDHRCILQDPPQRPQGHLLWELVLGDAASPRSSIMLRSLFGVVKNLLRPLPDKVDECKSLVVEAFDRAAELPHDIGVCDILKGAEGTESNSSAASANSS